VLVTAIHAEVFGSSKRGGAFTAWMAGTGPGHDG
jgi:hypothetical protein